MNNPLKQPAMSLEEAYANAVISDALDTDDEAEVCGLWQYRLWSFQGRDTKLVRFLHKNQHTQRELLNLENWINGKVSKSAKI